MVYMLYFRPPMYCSHQKQKPLREVLYEKITDTQTYIVHNMQRTVLTPISHNCLILMAHGRLIRLGYNRVPHLRVAWQTAKQKKTNN